MTTPSKNGTRPHGPSQQTGLTPGHVYYILFKQKWKIIICTIAGFVAAALLFLSRPVIYQSEAKLFIHYVEDEKTPSAQGDQDIVKSTVSGAGTVIDTEKEILTSLDLSKTVAKAIGPRAILGPQADGSDVENAAIAINRNLSVFALRGGNVIHIIFESAHPDIVEPVLKQLIASYLKMHVDVHHSVGIDDDRLTQETDQLRARLARTEDELRKTRTEAGVISLSEAKKSYMSEIAKIRQALLDAQAEYAERNATLRAIIKQTNVTSDQALEYSNICTRLQMLKTSEAQLLLQYTAENPRVKLVHDQITDLTDRKAKMDAANPFLMSFMTLGSDTGKNGIDVAMETARLTALKTRIEVLNSQLADVRKEASRIDQIEVSILGLQRKRDLEEANYRYFSANLEKSRIDDELSAGRVSNITTIQAPSAAERVPAKSIKPVAGLAVAGISIGLGWAFLIELLLDRSIRRPVEIERLLGIPLFLSIPDITQRAYRKLTKSAQKQFRQSQLSANRALPKGERRPLRLLGRQPLSIWDDRHPLYAYYEALRDRLIGYFESRNLSHKPKLIALTGLGEEPGVTTIAGGVASCLSKTGEGKVLLVDMTIGQESAQQFYKGKPACGLDEALETGANAQVEDNLFVVAEGTRNTELGRLTPNRFNHLIPKLKATDFDYIIFDMPTVSPISATPRLAGFMDVVLVVIESEKTNREIVERAIALLNKSNANIGAILNKTRDYVPRQFQEELLGLS